MTPQEMWNAYKQINPLIGDEIRRLGVLELRQISWLTWF